MTFAEMSVAEKRRWPQGLKALKHSVVVFEALSVFS